MVGNGDAGWLNSLAALWNADGLEAWAIKLVLLLAGLFLISAVFSAVQSRRAPVPRKGASEAVAKGAKITPVRTAKVRAPAAEWVRVGEAKAAARNLPKKPERAIRPYRPKNHASLCKAAASQPAPGLAKFIARERPEVFQGPVLVDFGGPTKAGARVSLGR